MRTLDFVAFVALLAACGGDPSDGTDGGATDTSTDGRTPARTPTDGGLGECDGQAACATPRTEEGWTELTPSADSQLIYVSEFGDDATGRAYAPADPEIAEDSFQPVGPVLPFASIEAGLAMLRDGFPDHLLFRRGDTWTSTAFATFDLRDTDRRGRSREERMVIGAYGDPEQPRPQFDVTGTGIYTRSATDFLAVLDLSFDNVNAPGSTERNGTFGMRINSSGDDILIEGCHFGTFNSNVISPAAPGMANVLVRRCTFTDNYAVRDGADRPHAQGLFVSGEPAEGRGIDGITLEENVFIHNGWSETEPTGSALATVFNHNMYLQGRDHGVHDWTLRGNWTIQASATGAQMRGGGDAEENVILECPLGINFGIVQGGSDPDEGGVTGTVRGNLTMYANDIQGEGGLLPRGAAWVIANVHGATFEQNIIAHAEDGSSRSGFGIVPDIDREPGVDEDVGVHDLTLRDNFVYDAGMAVTVGFGAWGTPHPSTAAMSGWLVEGNHFESPVARFSSPSPRAIAFRSRSSGISMGAVFRDNTYYGAQGAFVVTGSSAFDDLAEWAAASGETGARVLSAPSTFSDPNRGADTYADRVRGVSGSTREDLYDLLRGQRKGYWLPELETRAFIDYVRAGFDLQSLEEAP